MAEIRILAIGDVVGKPGRRAVHALLPAFRREHAVDLCVANAENAAGGSGITGKTVEDLFRAGVDVITLGDHTWKKKDALPVLAGNERVVRPLNYPPGAAGFGHTTVRLSDGTPICVINLLGRVFLPPIDCPFRAVDGVLARIGDACRVILLDVHAEATSEKVAMGWYLDGRVSAVWGTHTHVQTADERILPKGTAYVTDLGMTGPYHSVIGREIEPVLHRFLTGMPTPFGVATRDVRLSGVLLNVDPKSGRASAIERVQLRLPDGADDGGGDEP